jgi:hypothetical protein
MLYLTCEKEADGLCSGRLTSFLHNIIEVIKKGCLVTLDHFERFDRCGAPLAQLIIRTVQFRHCAVSTGRAFFPGLCCI